MSRLPWLDPDDDEEPFPNPERALHNPDGLLAVGGSLAPRRLLRAYRAGIFPWYSEGQPILWWTPDPRTILLPDRVRVSRSLRKSLRNRRFRVTVDENFDAVIRACASSRRTGGPGTWLTSEMIDAYLELHAFGYAHSIETRVDDELVGGLYGVSIGAVFFGESMFSRVTDASKVALVVLCGLLERWNFGLIDCQMRTDHLVSMGAKSISRHLFREALERLCVLPSSVPENWGHRAELVPFLDQPSGLISLCSTMPAADREP